LIPEIFHMKKFSLIPLLLLAACAKTVHQTPTPAFGITAAINGVSTSFSSIITVDSVSTPGTLYIVAHSDSANLTPLLEITLSTGAARIPGTYTSTFVNGNPGQLSYTGWNGSVDNQYPSTGDTVTVTTSNKIWLAGTFQGTCAYTPDSTISITNGQFTVGWNLH
jgi:hypothetical protein